MTAKIAALRSTVYSPARKTWSVGTVPGADKLDFRDVKAFGEATAYLLSAGPGDASRIYKTTDGGKSWVMQFKSADPAAKIVEVHLYTFNAVEPTETCRRQFLAKLGATVAAA